LEKIAHILFSQLPKIEMPKNLSLKKVGLLTDFWKASQK